VLSFFLNLLLYTYINDPEKSFDQHRLYLQKFLGCESLEKGLKCFKPCWKHPFLLLKYNKNTILCLDQEILVFFNIYNAKFKYKVD